MAVVTMKQLLEAGVHFGHQTRRWNPKMRRFIFGERNGIYIIDLNQTLDRINTAYTFVRDMVANGGTILFVGTKKQTQDPIADHARKCGMPFINERWLGGMLTNFTTISARVKKMQEYERMKEAGDFEAMPKKEALILSRELEKLQRNLGGIRNLAKLPDAVFIIDTKKEHIAVTEANKLGMPIVAVVDTNCDPDLIQYVIPGNDDAIRAGNLMCRIISDAVEEGRHIASRRHAKAVAASPKPAADAPDPEAEARRLHQQAEARRQAALQAQEREARLAATRRHQQAVDIAQPEGDQMPAATISALAEHGATYDAVMTPVIADDDDEPTPLDGAALSAGTAPDAQPTTAHPPAAAPGVEAAAAIGSAGTEAAANQTSAPAGTEAAAAQAPAGADADAAPGTTTDNGASTGTEAPAGDNDNATTDNAATDTTATDAGNASTGASAGESPGA
ncbi:MAG: small subunit ribosomal protein [Actinomycetota bacterium]|nr:small subunit ribosomal protein [Actinomycetota bacterium]